MHIEGGLLLRGKNKIDDKISISALPTKTRGENT